MLSFFNKYKRYTFAILDFLCIIFSYAVIPVMFIEQRGDLYYLFSTMVLTCVLYIFFLSVFRCYRNILKYSTTREFVMLGISGFATFFTLCFMKIFIKGYILPMVYVFVAIVINICLTLCTRISVKYYSRYVRHTEMIRLKNRLLIVGAGSAGGLLLEEIKTNEKMNFNPVGFIDDDPSKQGAILGGVQILGTRKDIVSICERYEITNIIITIPSMDDADLQKLVAICSETNCKVQVLPGYDAILSEKSPKDNLTGYVRDVDIGDLLERDPVILDNEQLNIKLKDKTVLVTGGGGSIGSELCRQIAKYNPKKLIIVDIYENNAYEIQLELKKKYPSLDLDVIIASVRDLKKLEMIFDKYRPHAVYHAAAHKHVPLMEDAPDEAIKNNVFGTFNSAFCADKYNVDTFTLISTDKAVNPTNVMGATKRICEMIVQSFQSVSKTNFVAVRFGNVLGSNGSVIPLFKKQIAAGGPVTVTHKDITRFFMTIPEASQLVLQASAFAKGGEIFVLDMGKPVRIYHLAEKLISLSGYEPHKDIKIEVTGLRPGEKLYEELLMEEEGLKKTQNAKIFIGQPVFTDFEELKEKLEKLKSVFNNPDCDKIKEAVADFVPTYKPDYEKGKV